MKPPKYFRLPATCLFSCACVNPGLLSHPDLESGCFREFLRRASEKNISFGPFIILFFWDTVSMTAITSFTILENKLGQVKKSP